MESDQRHRSSQAIGIAQEALNDDVPYNGPSHPSNFDHSVVGNAISINDLHTCSTNHGLPYILHDCGQTVKEL